MKKLKLILFILPLLTFIGTLQVMGITAQDPPDDGGFGGFEPAFVELFTICNKVGRNCITVDTDTINNNQKYDLFEVKNKEIYLNNSDITLEILLTIEQQYVIHISGTNKIEYLNNLVLGDFIPFTVVGDGTLEIVTSEQLKTNIAGEPYYRCWYPNTRVASCRPSSAGNRGMKEATITNNYYRSKADYQASSRTNDSQNNSSDIQLLTQLNPKLHGAQCLTEASINASEQTVTFNIPKYGYTKSDIKEKFSNDIDVFYRTEVGLSLSVSDFNSEPPQMLKNFKRDTDDFATVEGRMKFIDDLVSNYESGVISLECNTKYLRYSDPATEETQITSAWGLEYIKTDLRRSFSSDGHYLINFPEEKTMITTTKKDNIVFESTEEFDPNYHLVVDDITEKITDVQSASVQAKTDKTLVELYDIYMADENDNIVKMENGTYKIKIELNDLLKKYEGYEIIYISEENKVELIDATVEGNYIVFNTTHLSKYGVVGKEIRKTGNIITNPQTADSVVTYGLALGALAVAVVLVVLRIRKLKRGFFVK